MYAHRAPDSVSILLQMQFCVWPLPYTHTEHTYGTMVVLNCTYGMARSRLQRRICSLIFHPHNSLFLLVTVRNSINVIKRAKILYFEIAWHIHVERHN